MSNQNKEYTVQRAHKDCDTCNMVEEIAIGNFKESDSLTTSSYSGDHVVTVSRIFKEPKL